MSALYANVKDSGIAEMSLRITKAAFNKSDRSPMKWAAIDSDVEEDLFAERMSPELYQDFCSRIESKEPVPEMFMDAICEADWCGGMPYLSISHYKAGTGLVNVPGSVDSVYIDGSRLKSKGDLKDTPMGRKVFDALRQDLYMEKSGNVEHDPVRISIGFLDLEHEHVPQSVGGQHYTFSRTDRGLICPLCAQGIGGKIYKKGQLIHLAMTRVPVNPRTRMVAEKSMSDEIITKFDDAKSIIGDLADELEEKSIANDVLVVRSDAGSDPTPSPSLIEKCYDPNNGGWDDKCIAGVFDKFMADCRDMIGTTVKSMIGEVVKDAVTTANKSNVTDKKSDTVEVTMDENKGDVEKGVMGIPEVPFSYEGIDGSGNNPLANPVKAVAADEDDSKDTKKDEKAEGEMKSTLDTAYESLKSILATAKSVEDVQAAFNALGTEVEKSYTPPAPTAGDLAEIVRSAVEAAVTPLKMELATLKASVSKTPVDAGSNGVVKSKALSFNGVSTANDPNALLQKALPQNERVAPKLSQIERLARKSTGVLQG